MVLVLLAVVLARPAPADVNTGEADAVEMMGEVVGRGGGVVGEDDAGGEDAEVIGGVVLGSAVPSVVGLAVVGGGDVGLAEAVVVGGSAAADIVSLGALDDDCGTNNGPFLQCLQTGRPFASTCQLVLNQMRAQRAQVNPAPLLMMLPPAAQGIGTTRSSGTLTV